MRHDFAAGAAGLKFMLDSAAAGMARSTSKE
jgi:hypothetical protein